MIMKRTENYLIKEDTATELCHKANEKVCLEGVEEAEEYDTVKEIGLELIQGFYFGHPIKADMFEKKFL